MKDKGTPSTRFLSLARALTSFRCSRRLDKRLLFRRRVLDTLSLSRVRSLSLFESISLFVSFAPRQDLREAHQLRCPPELH